MGLGRHNHITPVLRHLHLLPIRCRVQFKLATLVYRSLAGTAPPYLIDECKLIAEIRSRSLRSSDTRSFVVRRSHNHFGDRFFAAAGPSLPPQLRQPDVGYGRFRRLLQTFLFGDEGTFALDQPLRVLFLLTYLLYIMVASYDYGLHYLVSHTILRYLVTHHL
jgi:hypothetical protein